MDIFRAFLSAISSQWREPTKSVEELKSLSIFAFAQEVCSRLQHEIEMLPKEHSKSAPRGIFRGNLVGFQAKLMAHGEALNDDDAKRTRTALNMLEHLCRWPNPYYPVGPTDNSFSPAWYPYLRDMLLSNGECVRESLKAFFDDSNIKTAKKFWIRLIVSLDAAGIQDAKSTLRGPDLSELWERRNTIETCQDKEPFIVSLHNSLMKHCHCRCEPACDFIAANIRLNCNDEPPYPDNTVSNFNLLFQDLHDIHDNQNSQANCYWRDIQISVCATTTTRVTFEELSDDKKPKECDDVSEGSELLDELGLCQIITEARESQLQAQLIYSRGELRLKEEESVPSRRFITNVPSTSLASLLHCSKLTDRHKAILSYHLIDSVWQYYDCNWEVWSNETVHFMSEREGVDDSSEVVFVNQPFLHARFNDKMMLEANDGNTPANRGRLKRGGLKQSKPVAKPNQIQERKSHRYPKILALGIMLLEIQLGRKLESFKTRDYYDRNPHIAQHLLALDLLKDKKLWPPENAWIVIKEIIEMCIDEKKAKAILKDDSREIRQKIYDQIVAPFRVFIQEAWKPKSIEDVDSVTLEKAREPKGNENIDLFMLEKASRSEKDVTQVMEGLSHLSMNEQSLYQSIESAKEWLQKLDHLTEMLSIAEERDTTNCPQIKIAILDTGIEKEYYDDFKDFIEEYKDFASGKDEYQQDETGHGSSTLRLLLKLNFDVKVFVGRVFKRNEADNETERVMAKAIMHAKLKWKVDIICIPSGFSPYPPDQRIRDELYDAVTATPVDSKTLIFAAASNLGFRSEITYPGCLSQSSKLMCLFSTAGDGDPESPRFNPAAVPNTYNFALLGEGIKIDETDEKAVGGTSFSTVIAAAIAAYIMDFANHPDIKGKIRDVRYLREVEGMTSVFASMTALRKNGYHILEPWKLMDYDQCTLLDKKEQREEIRRNISAALRKRYSRRHL